MAEVLAAGGAGSIARCSRNIDVFEVINLDEEAKLVLVPPLAVGDEALGGAGLRRRSIGVQRAVAVAVGQDDVEAPG